MLSHADLVSHCVKAEKKEANEDWSEAQRSDPILAKIIEAKKEDKRPTRNDISAEGNYESILGAMGWFKGDKQVLILTLGNR